MTGRSPISFSLCGFAFGFFSISYLNFPKSAILQMANPEGSLEIWMRSSPTSLAFLMARCFGTVSVPEGVTIRMEFPPISWFLGYFGACFGFKARLVCLSFVCSISRLLHVRERKLFDGFLESCREDLLCRGVS